MTTLFTRSIPLVALLAANAAHAEPSHEITLGSSTRALRTSSANALTEESLGGGALGYAHRLGAALIPRLEIWGEASVGWGSAGGTMFQTLTTELDTLSFTVGGRARYPLRSRIIASARLDLGMARAGVAIRDSAGHTARDAGWGATSAATLGLDLVAIRSQRFRMALRFDLGVIATSPIGLVAEPEPAEEDTLKLEMSATGLGSVNLSGTVFAATLVTEF